MDVRSARVRDALVLRRWRNESSVRGWSGNSDVIGFGEHLRWFRHAMTTAGFAILIGVETDGTRVGTVQFREDEPETWVVSVTVAPDRQGNGYGTSLLTQGEAWLCDHRAVKELLALVRSENAASLRIFAKCGFSREGCDFSGFERLVKDLRGTQ